MRKIVLYSLYGFTLLLLSPVWVLVLPGVLFARLYIWSTDNPHAGIALVIALSFTLFWLLIISYVFGRMGLL